MSRWVAAAIVAAGCATRAPRPASPLMPSHARPVAVATFAPTTLSSMKMRRPETRTAAVTVGAGADDARGGADAVIDALRAHRGALHRCFVRALELDPALRSVRVPLRVKIGAHGTVDFARADGGPARLTDCVAAVARRISLPAGAPLDVQVPLSFHASR